MLVKPQQCEGCPLYLIGKGFSVPEGRGTIPLLIVGEALGPTEARDGLPFRVSAQAGSLLEYVIRRSSFTRDQFVLWNVVACQPPSNELRGYPYERAAIEHCRVHFDRVVEKFRPKAILALGATATEALTGLTGGKLDLSYIRGYPIETRYGWVIPSFHPAHIRRGATHLVSVLQFDLIKAKTVAETGYKVIPVEYTTNPSKQDVISFLDKCHQANVIACDIETWKRRKPQEPLSSLKGQIRSVQFSLAPLTGIYLDWSEHEDSIKRILALRQPKLFHSGLHFDIPVLEINGAKVEGIIYDTRWMFHHLQPDLSGGGQMDERGEGTKGGKIGHLQGVASFFGMDHIWKHLEDSSPAEYGCTDVDALQRIAPRMVESMKRLGIWEGYTRHVRDLWPIVRDMGNRGIPVLPERIKALSGSLQSRQDAILTDIQSMVPDELLECHPKDGYKREPKDTTGMVQRDFRTIAVENGGVKEEVTRRWCKVKPFLPSSHVQMKAYIRSKGHPMPKSEGGKDTAAGDALMSLYSKTGDPLYKLCVDYKKLQKISGTYVDNFQPDHDGRVRFHVTFTPATGQLATTDGPSTMTTPTHGGLASEFRRCMVAEPGYEFVVFDYKSFHALTLGYEAQDADYMRLARLDVHSYLTAHLLAIPGAENWLSLPDKELERLLAKVKQEHREVRDKKAKPSILGRGFGLGPENFFKMNRDSFVPSGEEVRKYVEDHQMVKLYDPLTQKSRAIKNWDWDTAKRLVENKLGMEKVLHLYSLLDLLFPKTFVEYPRSILSQAYKSGRLVSAWGFHRYFYDLSYSRATEEVTGGDARAALAFLPANDAFGIIKEALLRMEGKGWLKKYGLVNMIHDSLIFHCPIPFLEECKQRVRDEMEKPAPKLRSLVAPGGLWCEVDVKAGKDLDI